MDKIISWFGGIMSKETTKKRSQSAKTKTQPKLKAQSRAKARKRQKQKLIITAVLAVILIIVCAVAILVMGGFLGKTADENSVYILEDGRVVSTNIENFDESDYSKDELKVYMKEVINDYNQENGASLVKQKSFQLKNGVASSVLQYENADVFEEFFGTELFVGTIAEAIEEGYTFDIPFASVNGTVKEVTSKDFVSDESYKVAIIRANTKVKVEGTIYYISTENIAELGTDYVVIKAGAVEDGFLSDMEMLESTEAVAVDGAVSDDDLLSEDGGMIFDFGEEEIKESKYADTYTYIIYK